MNTKVLVKKGIIYKIDFPNNKIYIGLSTKTLAQTIARYTKELRIPTRPVSKALKKWGIENCLFSIVENLDPCTLEELCAKEIEKIAEFRSNVRGVGYNLKLGGQFGSQLHPNTKKKIGKKAKERLKDKTKHPLWGKHHSEETRKKISDQHKGKYFGKYTKRLTKKQLITWFEEGWNFLEAYEQFGVKQKILESSLEKHYQTKSLEEALNGWRTTLKGFNHKGLKRKFLSLEQLVYAFEKGFSSRKFYKEFNFNQRALERELKFHFGTKSWVEAKRLWKESLHE